MDLGYMQEGPSGAIPSKKEKPKKQYPRFSVHDKQGVKQLVKALGKSANEIGKEFTATVCLRLAERSQSKSDYGNSIGFDVMSMEECKENGEEPRKGETMDDYVGRRMKG